MQQNDYEEEIKNLEKKYHDFLATENGQKWKDHRENELKSEADFGYFVYDFFFGNVDVENFSLIPTGKPVGFPTMNFMTV